MSTLIYSTFANLARTLNRDRRHPALREIEPDAYLRLGDRLVPIFAQGDNGGRVATTSTNGKSRE
jgi:hypothetical protein